MRFSVTDKIGYITLASVPVIHIPFQGSLSVSSGILHDILYVDKSLVYLNDCPDLTPDDDAQRDSTLRL